MILEIKNLEASYGSLKVLKGINISAKKGDLVALVGPNGSGKSTILKCVCGLLKPENGKILFNNNSVVEKRPDEIVCLGISYVPQGRLVFETLTVEENLEIGGFILKDKELVQKRIKEVYEHFPMLQNIRKQKATFLSGGQQQMLSIGRSLMLKDRKSVV